ncbi:DNA-directed RNA polymerase I subunit rpa49 [Mycoblastus sanguinarius]|nr:DNA-directed RNA polymerase I subunit rpa49 [Mycoblastus sanguinarius]
MSEKKRKRTGHTPNARPHKKLAKESPHQTVKISVIEDGDHWMPVLASTPGISLPSKIALKPYTKTRTNASRTSVPAPELLLHSSAHARLDYTAREGSSNGSESHLIHYIGVYDPENGELQLVQARKMVVRSTLRTANERKNDGEEDAPNPLSARSTLGLAFGTKKSQKAIRAQTANAIAPSPSKTSQTTDDPTKHNLDPLASAVVSSMAASTASMPTREQMQSAIDENKPRPKPNLAAESLADVYTVEQLVGGEHVLRAVAVKEWMDKVAAGEDVQTRSLFVSRRLRAIVQGGDVKRVKVLRYLLLLIEWYKTLKVVGKGGKKVPKLEDMASLVEGWGSDLISGLSRRFADGSQLNKWHLDNLLTHILALALTLDNYTTDTHDMREDLRLESREISQYYAELGCAVAAPTEAERTKLGIGRPEIGAHRVARLRIPLTFPKMRAPITKKRGR